MSLFTANDYLPGQSLHSVLYRIAKKIGYSKYNILSTALNIGDDFYIRADNKAKLSSLISGDVVRHLESGQLTNQLRKHIAVCPVCLHEAPYHRELWRSSYVPICPVHHVGLISKCPNCELNLTWAHLETETRCKCGCSLAYVWRPLSLSPSQVNLLAIIVAAVTRGRKYERFRRIARIPGFLKKLNPQRFLNFISALYALIQSESGRRLETDPCSTEAFFRIDRYLCDWERIYTECLRARLRWRNSDRCFLIPHASLNSGLKSWMAFLETEPHMKELRIRLLRLLVPYRVIGFEDLYQSTPNWLPVINPNDEYVTIADLSRDCELDADRLRHYLNTLGIAVWASDREEHDVVFVPDVRALAEYLSGPIALDLRLLNSEHFELAS